MIPRTAHTIWIGEQEIPRREKHWREALWYMNPKFKHRTHGNELFQIYKDDPYINHLQKSGAPLAFVVDRFRMLILRDEGGIYLDTDCEPLKPLDGIPVFDDPTAQFMYGIRDPVRPGVALHRGIALVDNTVLASMPNSKMVNQLLNLWTPECPAVTGHRLGIAILAYTDISCRAVNFQYFYAMTPTHLSVLLHDPHNAGSWVNEARKPTLVGSEHLVARP